MIKAVIDTNVLVSALLNHSGSPAKVFNHVLNGIVVICFDSRIISEYEDVLARPKFSFNQKQVKQILQYILHTGISLVPVTQNINFLDEDDKAFYEVAISAEAYLVTGNSKHYPKESRIISPQDFLREIEKI